MVKLAAAAVDDKMADDSACPRFRTRRLLLYLTPMMDDDDARTPGARGAAARWELITRTTGPKTSARGVVHIAADAKAPVMTLLRSRLMFNVLMVIWQLF